MSNENSQENASSGTTMTRDSKWHLPMNISLIVWLILELVCFSFPSLVSNLSFFDSIAFSGVKVRSACLPGDPTINARLLMSAWMISFALTIYTFLSLFKNDGFYRDFVDQWRADKRGLFVGRYSAPRFRIYYVVALACLLIIGPYYYFMFAGSLGYDRCNTLLADRWLFLQGVVVITAGYFLGAGAVIVYRTVISRS
ncbi:MAG TPA: hypothetical protein VEG37_08850 [Burkholderiales bacterium]|nr:hypothetical protein [Burkholderiales bacterium]